VNDLLKLKGTGVAMVTPFRAGEIDFPALGRIINHLIDGKVEFLVSLGTTGEATALTVEETQLLLDFTVEQIAGRIPLIFAPFGMNNTAELVRKVKSFDLSRVDVIMASSPAYVKPTQEGIYQHYMHLADASPKPVIIYNVPGRTASVVKAETTLRLAADHSNLIGVKEASTDMMALSKLIKDRPDDFLVFSGDDITAFPTMALGADGLISVLGNAFPYEMSEMIRLALQGKYEEGAKYHLQLLDIHKYIYAEGNPTGIKMAMSLLGLCESELRLPLVELSAQASELLEQEISRSGLKTPSFLQKK